MSASKDKHIQSLSPHLFWDVDSSKLDMEKNKTLIIQRILEYGLMSDWELIQSYYGIQKIASTLIQIRSLDKKALSYISLLSGIPKNEFRCYTTKQSIPLHWDF